jgi:diguanylate cyclase (GGDEF)-like protein
MPEICDQEAKITAERLRQEIEETPMVVGRHIHLTTSFGVACWDGKEELSFETLLYRADQALYRAKDQGRNCVTVWKENYYA